MRGAPGAGIWDVGYGMFPRWSSELTASPAWGPHEGHWEVEPPGAAELEPPACGILKNPPFGAKAGAWRTGSQTAALGCIPEGGKDLTLPAGRNPLLVLWCLLVGCAQLGREGSGGARCSHCGWGCSAGSQGTVPTAPAQPCVPRSVLLVGKGLDPWNWGAEVAGILQVTGAVGHSCAAGRAGLSPSPNSLGIRWCRALVREVFTRCV